MAFNKRISLLALTILMTALAVALTAVLIFGIGGKETVASRSAVFREAQRKGEPVGESVHGHGAFSPGAPAQPAHGEHRGPEMKESGHAQQKSSAMAGHDMSGQPMSISSPSADAHARHAMSAQGGPGRSPAGREKPRTLELKPAQVREYLEEIGAWEPVGRKWESEGKGRWRESYTKHAKTYVRVGKPDQDESWREPVGMMLDLVPEKDPTRVAAGEEFTVRLLKDGQPAPDLAVELVAGNAKSGSLSKTDSGGRARLRLERAGWWLIRATILDPSSKPDLDWETRFMTLTIFVGAR